MERYGHLLFTLSIYTSVLFFSPFFFAHGSAAQLSQTQTQIMRNLSITVHSISPPSNSPSWNTSDPNPCFWDGVTCSSPGSSVVTLSLSRLGLSSLNSTLLTSFFDLICNLTTLQLLDLSSNSLNTLPHSFFSDCTGLTGLQSLNLSSNRLTGSVSNFSSFGELVSLDLSFNAFSGTVGTKLDSLTQLKSLNLSFNLLSGSAMDLTKSLKTHNLEELVISSNKFSGPFPSLIFKQKNLTILDLSQNNLTGSVPDSFRNLSKLETLLLSANNFTGTIPPSISNITKLSRFAAYQNKFFYSIPSGLTKYVNILDLSYNKLSGEIPSDLLSPSTLDSIDLTGNRLHGSIPFNLSRALYRLRLGGNSLNGNIPASIGNLSNLSYLELDGNYLGEEIPSQLGNCKHLTLLNLASNKLQGELPHQLGKLTNLVVLQLQMNNLSGAIPSEISNLFALSTLNLSANSLTGEIPHQISQLGKLSILNLNRNNLEGPIPVSIKNLSSLIELQLGSNKLSGTIPTMPASLTTALNLSHNLFSGPIPSSSFILSNQLEIIDLSYNNFSGQVPTSLATLQSLTLLDLSYNNLSGTLPGFPSWVNVITTGNSFTNSTQNQGKGTSKRKMPTALLVILITIGALLGLGFVAVTIMFLLSKRFYRVEDVGIQSDETNLPHIINGCLITTNSIHTSSIDFTKSMESVSDPTNIFLKTRFCTYFKVVMPKGTTYSVKKLNWSDKLFQMGNQEKFTQELEVLGRLSNSNVMVPLAYVLTEDSGAYLFYEHAFMGTVFDALHGGPSLDPMDLNGGVLDWPCRYSVALGVAQGLAFLHGCTQPVLLLDLSTRTVHLKSLNEPQIGDIELYKVIDPSKSTGSLSTIAGTVGYIPPEYAYTMRLTMAGNVYSFGVILLELVTGKHPVSEGIELAKWALSNSARPEERERILDSRIAHTSIPVHSQMQSVLKIALACVAPSPNARPKMRNVLRMLFNAK